ncbi:hypothetical protein [Bernardetia sp.]|uniref:hypothetical protein n=1 Tax=Bernardetia sp. TaxID=1937974 RepID=UPI0025B80D3E|nr:hypothetical protein [Bernardetia sp.]
MYNRKEIITQDGYYLLEEVGKNVKLDKEKKLGLELYLRVEFRDNYKRTTIIPWNLDFKSKVLNYFINVFPPDGSKITKFFIDKNSNLCILYEEYQNFENEMHFDPFNLDKKSEWLATFDFFRQKWKLKRIRYLEYLKKSQLDS